VYTSQPRFRRDTGRAPARMPARAVAAERPASRGPIDSTGDGPEPGRVGYRPAAFTWQEGEVVTA
jgi:hypothetical protein